MPARNPGDEDTLERFVEDLLKMLSRYKIYMARTSGASPLDVKELEKREQEFQRSLRRRYMRIKKKMEEVKP